MDNKTPESVAGPQIIATDKLAGWLIEHNISLGFTARRANKLFLAGVGPDNELSLFERSFDNASGLAVYENSLFLSGLFQVWHLHNPLLKGQSQNGYDRVYLPQSAYTTGDCAIHEMAVNSAGQLLFVNTRFSCISALSPTHSFKPLWKPEFITDLVPEDRCHLNGMALSKEGQIKYLTCCSSTDTKEGWREHREKGGCLIDAGQNKIVLKGLCMPHSPRIFDGKVWLLNSGHGELGFIDFDKNSFKPIITCPGFLRGLVFVDHYAVVTISKPRAADAFSGLPLDRILESGQMAPECGVLFIDLKQQEIVHQLKIEGIVEELMDIAIIPGCRRPMLIGVKTNQINNIFSIDSSQSPKPVETQKNPILV